MRGRPTALEELDTVTIPITTEAVDQGTHEIFFNRGAAASQEYARRFQNKKPNEVGDPAYRWLSRGLVEALLAFVAQAKDASFGIHAAVYEFESEHVIRALKEAHERGARVSIVYDAAGAKKDNVKAITKGRVKTLTIPRSNSKIAHNKFFVLTKNGRPIQVWTGSTNLTENGIYGHSNLGHLVRDEKVTAAFLEYWHELSHDPEAKDLREWTSINPETPIDPVRKGTTTVFSLRQGLSALDWYASLASGAQRGLFMTFAFGMHQKFVSVYEQRDKVIRYALMENKGMSGEQAAEIDRIRKLPNVTVALGARVMANRFDRWLEEMTKIDANAHVLYVHTKYMLVDPLGEDPIVVTGSANFSVASTTTNDENMLVIRGNTQIADVYLGRVHAPFHPLRVSRMAPAKEEGGWRETTARSLRCLAQRRLLDGYYKAGADRALRRAYFAGG